MKTKIPKNYQNKEMSNMENENNKKPRRRGRPPNHPKIKNLRTGTIHDTYASAAREINGYRDKVYRCCNGMQRSYKGCVFIFEEEETNNK